MTEPAAPDRTELPAGARPEPKPVPHAGLRYSALRLAVLLGVGLVLYLLGFRSWLLLLLALVVSGMVSYVLLMRVRDDAAANLESWVQRRSAHRRAVEEAEDAELIAQAGRMAQAPEAAGSVATDPDQPGPDQPGPDQPSADQPGPDRQGQTPA